jgi:hypothetical protein
MTIMIAGQRSQAKAHSAQPPMPSHAKTQRQHDHRADGEQQKHQPGQGQRERQEIELDEAALLGLAIDHVERIDHGLHAGIGAPQRDQEADDKGRAQSAAAALRDPGDLFFHNPESALRHQRRNKSQMARNGRRLGKQRIRGYQRGNRRKQGEQSVEDDASRHRQQAVIADPGDDAPSNVLPARQWNLERRFGAAAAPGLRRAIALLGGRPVDLGFTEECGFLPRMDVNAGRRVQTRGLRHVRTWIARLCRSPGGAAPAEAGDRIGGRHDKTLHP